MADKTKWDFNELKTELATLRKMRNREKDLRAKREILHMIESVNAEIVRGSR